MTNEEKSLLLQDLCARLPYGVQCKYNRILPIGWKVSNPSTDGTLQSIEIETSGSINVKIDGRLHGLSDFKPYLRSMSSMTEEEDKEWQYYKGRIAESCDELLGKRIADCHDFFNSHHIDYRGLIQIGAALPAKEGMYNN